MIETIFESSHHELGEVVLGDDPYRSLTLGVGPGRGRVFVLSVKGLLFLSDSPPLTKSLT